MSSPPPPRCPNCGRQIAAWRLDHCVYCGAVYPPDFKEGVPEPEGLKWVDRPAIPAEAARQLEMMKVLPLENGGRARSLVAKGLALLSVPLFGGVLFLAYRILQRRSEFVAVVVLVAGALLLGYLLWRAFQSPD